MSQQGSIFEEATGTYVGELLEDMIDTVSRTHKMYCDVDIPQFFSKDKAHPLTYVPLWAMSLPLKKGDKVIVEFYQNDLTLPMLYKNPSEIDKGFYTKFDFPTGVTGGNIKPPTAEQTFASFRLGDNSYVIKTSNYTVFHQNNGYILIDKDNKIYIQGSEINMISTGNLNMDISGKTTMFSPTGTYKIGNNVLSLGKALSDMASALNTILTGLGTITTTGTAAAQSTATWYATWSTTAAATDIANITALQTTLPNSFES